jgi:pyridoxamine 5'-phosphate oxidase
MSSTTTMPPPPPPDGEDEDAGLSDIGRAAPARGSDDGATDNIDEDAASNDDDDDNSIIIIPNWKERIDVSIARSRKMRGSNYVQISTIDVGSMEPRCRTVVFRGFLGGVVPSSAAIVSDVPLDGGRTTASDYDGGDAPLCGGGYYGDCAMKMITDSRSNKVREASTSSGDDAKTEEEEKEKERRNDVAELVWWFPKSSEQYRVRGRLRFVGGGGEYGDEPGGYLERERRRQWGNLSDMAREQFYWGHPGAAYSGKPDVPAGGRDPDDGTVLPPPRNFLLMLLIPTRVDYLRLTDNYHQVDEWRSRGGGGSNDDNEEDGIIIGGSSSSSSSRRWKSIRVNP